MNYDSYLLWLAYFSSVTAELLAVGSGGGGETKRRIASMNIAFLERKINKYVKKISLSNRILKIAANHVHFYFQNATRVRKEQCLQSLCVCPCTWWLSTMKTQEIRMDFIFLLKVQTRATGKVPTPAGSNLPTSSENFSGNKAMIVYLLSYFRLYIALLSFLFF